jgi:ubiquinone/menaquinone biosynthesis C-methylase UbiE
MNQTAPLRFVMPEVVSTHFHLEEGSVVADFGAGVGYFIPALSKAVGPTGRVIACEIQKALVEKLGSFVRQQGLGNVNVVWCDLEAPQGNTLVDNSIDAGVMINTFFQFEEKAAAVAECQRVLKKGGALHVIDWSESFGGTGPAPEQVVDKQSMIAWFEGGGFVLEREYPAGSHHYGLTFRVI